MSGELTIEFLQDTLRKYEKDDTLVVLDTDSKAAVGDGENFISDVKKVLVRGYRVVADEKIDYQINVIAKLMLTNTSVLTLFPIKKFFENETNSYNTILPTLTKYTADGILPVPACIYADENIVVMENLRQRAYDIINKHEGLNLNQIESILKVLGKLHATSFVMSIKDPKEFKEMAEALPEIMYSSAGKGFRVSHELGIEVAILVVRELNETKETKEIIRVLENLQGNCMDNVRALLTHVRPNRVINHGDTWSNNILLNKDDDVILIDFQVMRYASVAADLTYFLHVNMKPKARNQHMNRLLEVYLKALNECIEEVGCKVDSCTMDWLLKEMQDFKLVGFIISLLFLPIFHYKKEDLVMNKMDTDLMYTLEYQWSMITPDYKESLLDIVFDYMKNK